MKKIKLGLLSAMMILVASCAQQKDSDAIPQGENYQLSVGVQKGTLTRADNEFPNTDLTAKGYAARYIVEIYNNNDGELYKRMEQADNKFEFRLVKEQKYDFLVWVDYVKADAPQDLHYKTSTLKTIEMRGKYLNNDASRDAFYYAFTVESGTVANDFGTVVCQRPFGRLDITTTDWEWVKGKNLEPKRVVMALNAPMGFNVLTGEPIADATYNGDPQKLAGLVVDGQMKLTCDYIFVGGKIQENPDVSNAKLLSPEIFFLDKNGANITSTQNMLVNLPVYRNYITNVKGKLITKQGALEVAVNPEWNEPNVEMGIPDAGLSTSVYDALMADGEAFVDQKITKTTSPVTVPGGDAPNTININSEWDADGIFTIMNAAGEDYTGLLTINIEVPEGYVFSAQQLKVELENATVFLSVNGKLHATVSTGEHTFIVGEDSKLGALFVKQGAVEVRGSVDAIVRDQQSENFIHVCKIGEAVIGNWMDLTLENKFITSVDHKFAVTFNAQGGSEVETQLVADKDGKASEPTAPTMENYDFKGWFTDAACTTAWDFASVVSHNITLFAKWELSNVFVSSITLDKTSVILGGAFSPSPSSVTVNVTSVLPENATNKTVTWTSSNTDVATVDQNGKITYVSGGSFITGAKKATVTVTANDGSGVVATVQVETWK